MKVSQETHDKVVKIVNETLDDARRIWKSGAHLILPLTVEWFDNRVKVAGLAHTGRNKVSYNSDYIGQEDFWATTVKHEVAHHIQNWIYPRARQAHGPEFRRVMKLLGCSGRTRHSMSTPKLEEFKARKRENQIEYVCPTCNKSFHLSRLIHRKIQMGQKRWCASTRTCSYAKRVLVLKSQSVNTKEVDVEEIIPESHKVNLISPQPSGKVIGPAKLSDIISKDWWN